MKPFNSLKSKSRKKRHAEDLIRRGEIADPC